MKQLRNEVEMIPFVQKLNVSLAKALDQESSEKLVLVLFANSVLCLAFCSFLVTELGTSFKRRGPVCVFSSHQENEMGLPGRGISLAGSFLAVPSLTSH